MSRLPYELWQQICFCCNTKTLKSLRLVNLAFDELAGRALFTEVYVAVCLEDSLIKLQHIAAHPVLRKYVAQLSFLQKIMADCCTYESWKSQVDLRDEYWYLSVADIATLDVGSAEYHATPTIVLQESIIPKEHCGVVRKMTVSEEYLERCYGYYARLCSKQEEIIAGNLDIRKTALAFRELPNLQSVRSYDLPLEANKLFDALVNDEETPVPFLSRLQRATLLENPFMNSRHQMVHDSFSRSARPLSCLISAPSRLDVSSRIQELAISGVPWCFWQPELSVSYWNYYRFHLPRAFQNLRIIKLGFYLGELNHYLPDAGCVQDQLISFLSAGLHVEVLELSFHTLHDSSNNNDYPVCFCDLSEVLRQCTWPNLKSLNLQRCAMSEDTFIEFMRRHSHQLKIFKATFLQMTDPKGSWKHAMETIAPFMTLNTVRLTRLQDDEIKDSVMADSRLTNGVSTARQKAYYAGVSEYLKLGGKAEYPVWDEVHEYSPMSQ